MVIGVVRVEEPHALPLRHSVSPIIDVLFTSAFSAALLTAVMSPEEEVDKWRKVVVGPCGLLLFGLVGWAGSVEVYLQVFDSEPGFWQYRWYNEDFGWTHQIPRDVARHDLLEATLTVRAYDVDLSYGEVDLLYADGGLLGAVGGVGWIRGLPPAST